VTSRREEPELKCPMCGYDLRGSLVEGDLFRCPECGGRTDISQIVNAFSAQQYRQRQMLMFAFTVLLLVAAATIGKGILDKLHITGMGLFGFCMLAVILWLSSLRWATAPWVTRVVFALGGASLMVLDTSIGAGRLLLFVPIMIWFVGFHIWALRQGYL